MSLVLLAIGILLLYAGGEFLVRNASALASRLGISPLVIGLTVVAFGTSAPELAATLVSVFNGVPELAVGNVVGSNTANVGLILGAAALVYPLAVSKIFFRRDFFFMMIASILLIPVLLNGSVSRLEGGILVVILLAYLAYLLKFDPDQVSADDISEADVQTPVWRSLSLLILGIVLLVVGARSLVAGAIEIASSLGVPEEVIGLTFVAFGTSLPELASAIIAASKRQTDIILGNVVGSNIFNVLAILGITSLVKPLAQPFADISADIWIMLGFSVAIVPLFLITRRLGRTAGSILLSAYIAYIAYLFIR